MEPFTDSLEVVLLNIDCVHMPDDGDIAIDDSHFPDAVFRRYVLKMFDADHNGFLNTEERLAVTYIDFISFR